MENDNYDSDPIGVATSLKHCVTIWPTTICDQPRYVFSANIWSNHSSDENGLQSVLYQQYGNVCVTGSLGQWAATREWPTSPFISDPFLIVSCMWSWGTWLSSVYVSSTVKQHGRYRARNAAVVQCTAVVSELQSSGAVRGSDLGFCMHPECWPLHALFAPVGQFIRLSVCTVCSLLACYYVGSWLSARRSMMCGIRTQSHSSDKIDRLSVNCMLTTRTIGRTRLTAHR